MVGDMKVDSKQGWRMDMAYILIEMEVDTKGIG